MPWAAIAWVPMVTAGAGEPRSASVADHIGALARRLEDEHDPLVAEIMAAILAAAPDLGSDPVLTATTRASVSANVRRWATATIADPLRPVGIDPPPEALDLARDVIRRGMDRDGLLTAYRTGQNVALGRVLQLVGEQDLDSDTLIALLEGLTRSMTAYVDGVLAATLTQIDEERDKLLGGAASRQLETVNLILDGAPITAARASARLGYELGQKHLAAIAWGVDAEPQHLEDAVDRLARAIGAGRPLRVRAGNLGLWAWIPAPGADPESLAPALAQIEGPISLTVGSVAAGIAGFRTSHSEARAAQAFLVGRGDRPRRATYADLQVVVLAAQNEARADAFAAAVLGDLAAAPAELRETVRLYLQQDSNTARAAELLHAHRNTVLKRLERADALLPRPLRGRGLEVRLALELIRWRDPS